MTLPLDGKKADVGVETVSINSTPASDTFYTATSVLSPDPHDLTSPLSPLPLDVPRSGNVKNTGDSNTGACGALVDQQNESVSEVPIDDVRKIHPSHSKCNDSNVSAVQPSSLANEIDTYVQKALGTNDKNTSHLDQNVKCKVTQVQQEVLGALVLSPIPSLHDSTHSQDSHATKGRTASTPIETETNHDLRKKDSQSVRSRLLNKNIKTVSRSSSPGADVSESSPEAKKILSFSDTESSHPYPSNVDNGVSGSLNNNVILDNGNTKENTQDVVTDVHSGSQYNSGDNDLQKNITEASSEWYPGLGIKEKSELIPPEADIEKAAEVLLRLREKSGEGNASINEQVCL